MHECVTFPFMSDRRAAPVHWEHSIRRLLLTGRTRLEKEDNGTAVLIVKLLSYETDDAI